MPWQVTEGRVGSTPSISDSRTFGMMKQDRVPRWLKDQNPQPVAKSATRVGAPRHIGVTKVTRGFPKAPRNDRFGPIELGRMNLFQRHRWFAAAAGITLAFAAVSVIAHPSNWLTAFGDLAGLALMLVAAAIALSNALARPGHERSFWTLMALGF